MEQVNALTLCVYLYLYLFSLFPSLRYGCSSTKILNFNIL